MMFRLTTLKKMFLIGITISFVTLSLPSINLDVLGTNINFSNINFGILIPGSRIGDTQRGALAFNASEHIFKLSGSENVNISDQLINKTVQKIRFRLDKSNLRDIKVVGIRHEKGSFIKLLIPEYYSNSELIARWVTKKGNISFITNSKNDSSFNLSFEDLSGKFAVSNSTEILQTQGSDGKLISFPIGLHLVNFVKDGKFEEFKSYLKEEGSTILMSVDGGDFLYLITEQDPNNKGITQKVRFINTSEQLINPELRSIYYRLVSTFTPDHTLDVSLDRSEEEIVTIQLGGRIIDSLSNFVVLISITLVLFICLFYVKFKAKKALRLLFYLSMTFSTFVVLLKILSTPISVGVILGSIIFIIYGMIYLSKIALLDDESDLKMKIFHTNRYLIVSVITLVISSYLFMPLNQLTDTLITVLLGLIVVWTLNKYYFRSIFFLLISSK